MSEALDWAGSGLAYLTGPPDGTPDFSRATVLVESPPGRRRYRRTSRRRGRRPATMLAGRAAILGLTRRGRSLGGRRHPTAAHRRRLVCGRIAARRRRRGATGADGGRRGHRGDPWATLSRWAATHSTDEVVDRARLLDIAVAALGEAAAGPPTVRRCGTSSGPRGGPTGYWWRTCRRCGPGRCAVSCSLARVPSSSRWKAQADRTAPDAASGSLTG